MKISNYPKYDNLSQYLKTQEDLDAKLLLCRKVEESLFSQNNELLENTGTNDKKRIKNTTITNVNSNKSLVLRSTLMKQEEQKIQAKTIKTNIVKLNDSKDGQIMNVLKTENFSFFNTKRKESHSGFKLFKVIDPHAKTLLNEENKSKNSAVHLKTNTSNTAKSGISSENALSRLFKKQPTLTGQLKNSLAFSSNKDTKNKEINKQISNLESKILPTFLSNKENLSIEFPKTNKSFLKKATFAPEYNSNISKLLIVKNTNERKINNYQTDNIINTNHIINVIETKENIRDEESSEKKFSSRNITEQSNNLTNQNFSRLKKRNLNDNNLTKASKDLSNEINNSLDQETKVKGVSNSKTLISISENKNAVTDKSVDITNSRCFERQKSKKMTSESNFKSAVMSKTSINFDEVVDIAILNQQNQSKNTKPIKKFEKRMTMLYDKVNKNEKNNNSSRTNIVDIQNYEKSKIKKAKENNKLIYSQKINRDRLINLEVSHKNLYKKILKGKVLNLIKDSCIINIEKVTQDRKKIEKQIKVAEKSKFKRNFSCINKKQKVNLYTNKSPELINNNKIYFSGFEDKFTTPGELISENFNEDEVELIRCEKKFFNLDGGCFSEVGILKSRSLLEKFAEEEKKQKNKNKKAGKAALVAKDPFSKLQNDILNKKKPFKFNFGNALKMWTQTEVSTKAKTLNEIENEEDNVVYYFGNDMNTEVTNPVKDISNMQYFKDKVFSGNKKTNFSNGVVYVNNNKNDCIITTNESKFYYDTDFIFENADDDKLLSKLKKII